MQYDWGQQRNQLLYHFPQIRIQYIFLDKKYPIIEKFSFCFLNPASNPIFPICKIDETTAKTDSISSSVIPIVLIAFKVS